MKKQLILLIIIGAVVAVPILSRSTQSRDIKEVEVQELAIRTIRSSILASGKIAHEEQVLLTPEIVGRIKKIYINEGDMVERSQLLLEIDSEAYNHDVENKQAAVKFQEIAVERQDLNLKNLSKKWVRSKTLFDQKLLQEDSYDDTLYQYRLSKIDLKSSQASLEQARAELEQSKDQLNKTRIYSPIAGIVTSLDIEEGETVVPSTTNIQGSGLGTIANPDSIFIEVYVDEADIANVNVGQFAEIIAVAYPEEPMKGVVGTVASAAKVAENRQNLSFAVKIQVVEQNENISLRQGMSSRVEIFVHSETEVMAVPIESILTESGSLDDVERHYIYTKRNEIAHKVAINAGISDDEYQEITGNIEIGDEIVIGPDEILRNLQESEAIR